MTTPDPWQPDRWELQRLMLHIERGLVTQTHLRTLLIAAGNTVADHRRALRDIRARIKRRVSKARARVAHPTDRLPSAPARTSEPAPLRCC